MATENFSLDGNSLKLDGHIIYTPRLTKGEPGEQGLKGDKGDKGDSLTYDRLTPNLRINLKGEPGDRGLQGLSGLKGAKGDKGDNGLTVIPHFTATATIDLSVDSPHVDVEVTGTDLNPVLNFKFKGLRGINGDKGDKGDDGVSPTPYDDSDLRARIDELINAEEQRIKNLINDLNKEIKDDVKDMVKEAEFWQENLPEGIIGGNSNFGQDDVLEYLQQLGLWETSDGTTYTKWSTIKQSIDNIELNVRELQEHQSDGSEPINYESLASSLYTYINDHQSESGLQSTWTKFLKLDNEDIEMLEWVSSGVKSVASSQQSVTDLFAAAKNNLTGQEAYSGLNARVETIEGNYVSTTTLASYVNSSMSGVITQASLDGAVASLFAQNGLTKAKVSAMVSTGGESVITIDADNINLDGQTNFLTAVGEKITVLKFVSKNMLGNDSVVMNNSGLTMYSPDYGISMHNLNPAGLFYFGDGAIQYGGGLDPVYIGYDTNRDLQVNGTIIVNKIRGTSLNENQNYIVYSEGSGGSLSLNATVVTANGNIISSSDESLKNIVLVIDNIDIEQIANVRTINYEFKDHPGYIHSGTIAQDWQHILPYTVSPIDEEYHLGFDYASAALISSVIDAREIVKLKQENEELKQRLAAIEEKLA